MTSQAVMDHLVVFILANQERCSDKIEFKFCPRSGKFRSAAK